MSKLRWRPDYEDIDSVDDLAAHDVSVLRLERMGDEHYWLMFVVDGKEHHIDMSIRPGSRARKEERRIVAFNRGNLPPLTLVAEKAKVR